MQEVPLRSQEKPIYSPFSYALYQRCLHKANGLFAVISLLVMSLSVSTLAFGRTLYTGEYEMKAVFLYQLLQFAEWPQKAFADNEHIITIGILGKDPFGNMFKPVEGDAIDGRRLIIKRFEKGASTKSLKACQLLFISSSLGGDLVMVLKSLNEDPVLTVSEVKGFAELGGMVNFVVKKDKLKLEINQGAAERVGIKFRSKLLRLAERIVEVGYAD